jgi:hypothetical protein
MNTSTVEIPLGHLHLAAEILTYMTGRRVPVSHIRSGLSLEVHPCGCSPERYTIEVTEYGDIAIQVDVDTFRNTMTIRHDQKVTARFPIPGVITPAEGDPYIGIVDPGHPVQIGTIWDGEYKLTRRWGLLDVEQCEHWDCAQDKIESMK